MEISVEGYFKRIDERKNIRLINIEEESKVKLKNAEKNIKFPPRFISPILPNGLKIKHNVRSLVYDINGIPTSTKTLIGQKVKVRIKVKKFGFYKNPKSKDEFITGWNAQLLKMQVV